MREPILRRRIELHGLWFGTGFLWKSALFGFRNEAQDLIGVLTNQMWNRIATVEEFQLIEGHLLGNPEHHVIGEHISGALVFLASDLITPPIECTKDVQLLWGQRLITSLIERKIG